MEIGYTEAGNGTPVVLLHAFPLTAAMWGAQRDGLADDCRVIMPDQRGFGDTPLPAEVKPDLGLVADDVATLADRLGLGSFVLAGLSMGGYVALEFFRRYPGRVAGLLLADTNALADTPEAAANRERIAVAVESAGHSGLLATEILPNLLGETTRWQRPYVYEKLAERVREQPPAAVAWAQRAMAARPDSSDLLAGIDVPTLVLVGDQDTVTPPEQATQLCSGITDAQLRRIPAAGHLTAVEAPARFNAAVRTLLARV